MEKEHFKKADIEVKPSPIHRYGVFAKKDICINEVVEECPVVIFDKLTRNYQEALSTGRSFQWSDDNCVIALGYGSMYNHSEEPNAEFKSDYENEILSFIATKDIPAGAEVLISYGDTYWDYWDEKAVLESETPQKGLTPSFRVLLFLFFLLALSKIFPVNLYNSHPKSKWLTTFSQISSDAFGHLYTQMKAF